MITAIRWEMPRCEVTLDKLRREVQLNSRYAIPAQELIDSFTTNGLWTPEQWLQVSDILNRSKEKRYDGR